MNPKPKTIDISGVKYAMAGELDENYNFLERLAEDGQIGKVSWNGNNYYEVAATKKLVKDLRTVPAGYVRAVDHAIFLGSDSRIASKLCNRRDAQAKKVQIGGSKPAWFANKAWLEAQLGKLAPKKAQPQAKANVPASLATLQAEIKQLRDIVQAMQISAPVKVTKQEMPKKGIITDADARKAGFEPIQDIVDAFDIARGTLTSWYTRDQVRSTKVGARVYLHLDDVNKRADQLPGNRAKLGGLLGKTNGHVKSEAYGS